MDCLITETEEVGLRATSVRGTFTERCYDVIKGRLRAADCKPSTFNQLRKLAEPEMYSILQAYSKRWDRSVLTGKAEKAKNPEASHLYQNINCILFG